MRGGFEARLSRTYGLQISLTLVLVTLVFGFAAFVLQIQKLSAECARVVVTVGQVEVPEHNLAPREAVRVLGGIMSRTYYPGLVVTVITGDRRYEGRWTGPPLPRRSTSATAEALRPFVLSRGIYDPPPAHPVGSSGMPFTIRVETRSAGATFNRPHPAERIAGSMALLAGLVPARQLFGNTELAVDPETSTLLEVTVRTLLVVVLVCVIGVVLAQSLARSMAEQALRPLSLLLESLEARAAGDLLSRPLPIEREDELGRVIAAYNDATQITARALAERDAAEAKTHRFIADAGHQLRTPLTVLRGFVGILRKGQLRHPDDAPKLLEKAERQIALMAALIERMTLLENWHSAEPPAGSPTDVGALVSEVVGSIAAANPERDVRIVADPGAIARLDAEELTYAITNLISNALKYAREGPIDVQVVSGKSTISIIFSDHGPGIAPEELPHVFDRFYRGTRRDVPGSGLGLAITKLAAERAGGTVAAESTPGKGARFTITLPRVADALISSDSPSRSTE